MKTPITIKLDDEKAERVRVEHQRAIAAVQSLPVVGIKVVTTKLVDGVATMVAHGLGKTPSIVILSIVRGATAAGYVVETRGGGIDRSMYVSLTAHGYGATIDIDLAVF